MSTPPPLVANPENELVRLLGSPAGHALAAKVDDACRLVEHIEISDEEYARRHHWVPPISVGIILAQVMRPSVFIIQQAVDPSFHRTGYGAFEFPYSTIQLLQHALRKIMELVVRPVFCSALSKVALSAFFFAASYLFDGPRISVIRCHLGW
jgi:hypothetical protein